MIGAVASAISFLVIAVGFAMWVRGRAEARKDTKIADLERAEEIHAKAAAARMADADPIDLDAGLRRYGALRD